MIKYYSLLLFLYLPLFGLTQKSDYTISSYLTQGPKAPNTHYIGEAWLNGLLQPDSTLGYNITKATLY